MAMAIDAVGTRELVRRLRLVRVDDLHGYERPDDERVAHIFSSLRRTGLLDNPIVVDETHRLIIDGHHRLEAFRWLGADLIPTYSVDYLSTEVSVAGWRRCTNASEALVQDCFRAITPRSNGDWRVIAVASDKQVLTAREFASPLAAAVFQHRVARLLVERGATVALQPDLPGQSQSQCASARVSQISFYIDPLVEKANVLDISASHSRFPHQVNRHLVEGRPLRVRLPLARIVHESGDELAVGRVSVLALV